MDSASVYNIVYKAFVRSNKIYTLEIVDEIYNAVVSKNHVEDYTDTIKMELVKRGFRDIAELVEQ